MKAAEFAEFLRREQEVGCTFHFLLLQTQVTKKKLGRVLYFRMYLVFTQMKIKGVKVLRQSFVNHVTMILVSYNLN